MSAAATERVPVKYLPKALLGYLMEARLAAQTPLTAVHTSSPWDAWWACFRTAVPLHELDMEIVGPERSCTACTSDARELAACVPPQHPDTRPARQCGCLLEWAVRMRAPAMPMEWPPLPVTLALAKPGAPWASIRHQLVRTHEILWSTRRTLTTADTRQLYPEAYGADYVAARDAYLTCSSSQVLVLRARSQAESGAEDVKAGIRRRLGAGVLRNHLHMPDNPAEALADIAHLAGDDVLADVYERYARDRAAERLAMYRAALGIGDPGTDRSSSSR